MHKVIITLSFIIISITGMSQHKIVDTSSFVNSRGKLPWPIKGGIITSHFGKNQKKGDLITSHDGILLKTSVGAPVKCIANGEVAAVMDLKEFNAVMVKHGKYYSIYSMLFNVNVKKGDKIKAGTLVGKVTADIDGEGVFEFKICDEKPTYFNPEDWLSKREVASK